MVDTDNFEKFYASSFYYHDCVKEEEVIEIAPEEKKEPELDILTAVEPTPLQSSPPVKSVYSTYLHAGMAWNPAYNSLPEAEQISSNYCIVNLIKEENEPMTAAEPPIPADYFLRPSSMAKAAAIEEEEATPMASEMNESIPADYFLRRPEATIEKQEAIYKDSFYMGWEPELFKKLEVHEAKSEHLNSQLEGEAFCPVSPVATGNTLSSYIRRLNQ